MRILLDRERRRAAVRVKAEHLATSKVHATHCPERTKRQRHNSKRNTGTDTAALRRREAAIVLADGSSSSRLGRCAGHSGGSSRRARGGVRLVVAHHTGGGTIRPAGELEAVVGRSDLELGRVVAAHVAVGLDVRRSTDELDVRALVVPGLLAVEVVREQQGGSVAVGEAERGEVRRRAAVVAGAELVDRVGVGGELVELCGVGALVPEEVELVDGGALCERDLAARERVGRGCGGREAAAGGLGGG